MSTFETLGMDNAANLLAFPVQVYGSATTDSSGNFSFDITNVGLTHVYSVYVIAKSADNTVANSATAHLATLSLTTVFGHVTLPQNVAVLGGSPIKAAGAGLTVYIIVYGDQN